MAKLKEKLGCTLNQTIRYCTPSAEPDMSKDRQKTVDMWRCNTPNLPPQMGEMNWADLRGNELPFLILFEIGEEGTPRQIFSNIRHNFSANELASATVQSFEHKKWHPLYRFSKKVQLSRHRGPHRTKKNFSHSICLCLVRVRKVLVDLHCNSESTVMFSCTRALGRLATAPARNGLRARRAGGATPGPAHAPGRFAKAGRAGSLTVDLRGQLIYRGLSSDRAGRLCSIRTSKVSSKSIFLVCGKCAICDFPSETSATPLPPFRNALRLEKKLRTYEMLPKVGNSRRNSLLKEIPLSKKKRKRKKNRKRKDKRRRGRYSLQSAVAVVLYSRKFSSGI